MLALTENLALKYILLLKARVLFGRLMLASRAMGELCKLLHWITACLQKAIPAAAWKQEPANLLEGIVCGQQCLPFLQMEAVMAYPSQ